jgi:hypothetical protein
MKSTAEGAIAVMQQFKVGAKDLEGALGSMNQVAGDFAVEGRDLIEVVKKAGGAFADGRQPERTARPLHLHPPDDPRGGRGNRHRPADDFHPRAAARDGRGPQGHGD